MNSLKQKHYATALVDIGNETGSLAELVEDLRDVDDKINTNVDFKKYLDDRHVTFDQKKKALQAVFKDFISEKTYNFLYLLLNDGKLGFLSSIIELTEKTSLQRRELVEVRVESVVPLTAKEEKALEEKIVSRVGQKILLRNIINKDIIAGLRIFIGDTEIDGSLRGKIIRLKNKIEEIE